MTYIEWSDELKSHLGNMCGDERKKGFDYYAEFTVKIPENSKVKLELELDYGVINVFDGEYSSVDFSLDEEYTIFGEANLGSCNISNQTGSSDKILNIDVNAGSAAVYFEN
ncbi:MAG: hypothetical protein LUD27_00520 [Clostridia bacterium]|nr:hypothetical protein [Clostridia bacterium]